MASKRFELSKADWRRWAVWAVKFLLPVFVVYSAQVTLGITNAQGALNIKDLVPNVFTLGAITIYLLDRVYDLALKFIAGK